MRIDSTRERGVVRRFPRAIVPLVPTNLNFVKNRRILIKEIDREDSKLVLRRIALVVAVDPTR